MAKRKNYKKYSLNERIDYYDKIARNELKKSDKKITARGQYATGYVMGAEGILSHSTGKDFRMEMLGNYAGLRAYEKSKNAKF